MLTKAIDPVIAQNHCANEIIVVDNNLTDGTKDLMLKKYP